MRRARYGTKRQRWRVLVLLVSVALVAVACQSTTVATPVTAPTVDATPTPETSASAQPQPPRASTTVPEPTVDSEPAATPIPTPTPTATPTPSPAATVADLLALSTLTAVECPDDVAAEQIFCSVASVPLDVDNPVPDENTEIMVAFVDNGDPNSVGPVVFLQGGPGVGSVTLAKNFVGAAHDALFVDHRGTGYSTPKLDCPEVDALWVAQFSDDPTVRLPEDEAPLTAAYATCAGRLANEGINFDHFNTRSAAVDIELLRQLFQYDQWSIWGISYGTRLGLTVMRDHPAGVRAAVLDSVVPFEVDFFATIPENGIRAMAALDAQCDVNACAIDHGDFLSTLSEQVLALNESPVVVMATRPGTGEQFPFRVDGEQLVDLVFTQLYSTRALRSLPRQVSRADFGGLDEIVASYVTRRDPTQFDLSIGVYYTTWCREEFPFYDASTDDALLVELEAQFGESVGGALSSDGVDRLCAAFEVTPAPASEDDPLISPIRTLVFAGAFDPITPPAWSKQVADALPNSVYVEMANHGHGMATSCPVSIRVAFLIDPAVRPDTSCADQTQGPDFE